jgi:hypothetical protein
MIDEPTWKKRGCGTSIALSLLFAVGFRQLIKKRK